MRWHVRYRTPDGKQKGKTFLRKVDATRYLIEVESTKEAGNYIDPKRSKLTTGEWARKWLEMQTQLKPSTLVRYDGIVSKHIEPAWGTTPLAKISHADVGLWVFRINLAPASVRYIHRVFSLIPGPGRPR
jgi:hypothetical protein